MKRPVIVSHIWKESGVGRSIPEIVPLLRGYGIPTQTREVPQLAGYVILEVERGHAVQARAILHRHGYNLKTGEVS